VAWLWTGIRLFGVVGDDAQPGLRRLRTNRIRFEAPAVWSAWSLIPGSSIATPANGRSQTRAEANLFYPAVILLCSLFPHGRSVATGRAKPFAFANPLTAGSGVRLSRRDPRLSEPPPRFYEYLCCPRHRDLCCKSACRTRRPPICAKSQSLRLWARTDLPAPAHQLGPKTPVLSALARPAIPCTTRHPFGTAYVTNHCADRSGLRPLLNILSGQTGPCRPRWSWIR
jgi:hypothetical protein